MHSPYMINLCYGCHGNQHIGLKQRKISTRVYFVLPTFITSSSEWSALFITTDVPLWHRWVNDTWSGPLNYVPFHSHIQRNNGFLKTVCACVCFTFSLQHHNAWSRPATLVPHRLPHLTRLLKWSHSVIDRAAWRELPLHSGSIHAVFLAGVVQESIKKKKVNEC